MRTHALSVPTILGVMLLIVMAFIQETVIGYAQVLQVRPDVILLFALNWSICRGAEEGMLWGLVGGFVIDLFSGLPFGTSSAAYVIVAGLATFTERAFSRSHVILPMVSGLLATGIYYLVGFVIVASIDQQFFLTQRFLETVVGVAIFNAIVNPFVFWFIQHLDHLLQPMPRTSI